MIVIFHRHSAIDGKITYTVADCKDDYIFMTDKQFLTFMKGKHSPASGPNHRKQSVHIGDARTFGNQ